MNEFLHYARAAYRDMGSPNYEFWREALKRKPWHKVVASLKSYFIIEEYTDWDEGVSFSFALVSRSKRKERGEVAWMLWISAVGPFALLAYSDNPATPVRREDVITRCDSVDEYSRDECRLILSMLSSHKLRLLTAEEVESTVDFNHPDQLFPVTLFVLLFGDEDLPWRHAW